MASDSSRPPIPAEIWQRLERINLPDVEKYAYRPVPALGNRNIPELLEAEDGAALIEKYLGRLGDIFGLKEGT